MKVVTQNDTQKDVLTGGGQGTGARMQPVRQALNTALQPEPGFSGTFCFNGSGMGLIGLVGGGSGGDHGFPGTGGGIGSRGVSPNGSIN